MVFPQDSPRGLVEWLGNLDDGISEICFFSPRMISQECEGLGWFGFLNMVVTGHTFGHDVLILLIVIS